MEDKNSDFVEQNTDLVKIEDLTVDETQLAEQLYYSAGLSPIVDAGIKDYDKRIQQEDKLINKVFGTRGSDIRGYSESVARRVALAVYGMLNQQYGGKVGDMRSYIMSLEEERDRANTRYDDLMGRVIGVLGEEYKELRSDSKEYIEKLTKTLGDDLKDAKIDQKALAESLADIDGLRSQIDDLNKEKETIIDRFEAQITELKNEHKEEIRNLQSQIETSYQEKIQEKEKSEAQMAEMRNDHMEETRNFQSQIDTINREMVQEKGKYEAQIAEMKSDHKEEINKLQSQIDILNTEKEQAKEQLEARIAELDLNIKGLESDKDTLTNDLEQWKTKYSEFNKSISNLAKSIPDARLGEKYGKELYKFLLKDSKVPSAVIAGVGQFIDFKKYLELAVDRGAGEIQTQLDTVLETNK